MSEPSPEQERASASAAFGQALGAAAQRAGLDPAAEASTGQVVWRAMGGWRGVAESVLPSLVFVVVYTMTLELLWSVVASVGAAVVFTAVRLAQKSPPASALGGLVAAVAAAALALLTGNPSDNFVPGLLTNLAYGVAMLLSAVLGWPVVGLVAGYLTGEGTRWRGERRKRRTFFWLTIAWAGLFAARLLVQFPIYLSSLDGANRESAVALLGTLKIAMGLPLFAPLLAVTWLAARSLYARPAGAASEGSSSAPE
ncbi:MAG: DUF3159 domain-containing protein [Microbacterium sp.]